MAVVESTGRAISCLTGVPTASRICSCASPACPVLPSHNSPPGWGSAIANKEPATAPRLSMPGDMQHKADMSVRKTACLATFRLL